MRLGNIRSPKITVALLPRRSSLSPLPWSPASSKASSGRVHSTGTPSSAYFDHLDAVCCVVLFRCAKTGSVALICWLAQQHAAFTAKIGIYNLHKRCAEFLNACTASNASAYDYLTTYPRSSLYLALTGAAVNMLCMQLRASSSTFSACVSTYSVDTEQLVWCLYGVGCSGTSRFLQVSVCYPASHSALPSGLPPPPVQMTQASLIGARQAA